MSPTTLTPGAFHPAFEDLPSELPIFPLQGALLVPWGKLPLNIFEPRYLNMIDDCLGKGRMIGMIQPRKAYRHPGEAPVPLHRVGCAGRVSSFSESSDGRLLITLTGVIRFTVQQERAPRRGYRVITPTWEPYAQDLDVPGPLTIDIKALLTAMAGYISQNDLPMNLRLLQELKAPDLINSLAMLCPFGVQEKQALIEAQTLQDRADTLFALLQMATYSDGDTPPIRQ
jgi:Lon protease-like protein